MKMRILALQPHMHQEEILLGDHQETWRSTNFRQLLELEKRYIHRNPAECVRLTENVKTPDTSAKHAKAPPPPHKGDFFTRYHTRMKY
jgi:hypothetical protein